jgi:hypothetical protein
MVKYRRLKNEELEHFEREFINFLVINGIEAKDWVSLKKKKPQRAEKLVGIFSNVIFEKVLRQTHFIDRISENSIECLQCLSDRFVIVVMESTNPNFSFMDQDFAKLAENPPVGIKILTSEKKYSETREKEIFQHTEQGFKASDGRWFKAISLGL